MPGRRLRASYPELSFGLYDDLPGHNNAYVFFGHTSRPGETADSKEDWTVNAQQAICRRRASKFEKLRAGFEKLREIFQPDQLLTVGDSLMVEQRTLTPLV